MKSAKLIYKASLDGDVTVEQQIIDAENDSIKGSSHSREMKFEYALRYDITRTVINILSNSSIKYNGGTTPFCESLQKKLTDIFFQLHDYGTCFLKVDEKMRILEVNQKGGSIKLVDPAFEITGFTQKVAARKALDMYGVITDAAYSVIDERGVMGMFSPQKDTVVKSSQLSKLMDSFKYLFGVKKGQRKFMITEVPMTYSGVALPIADLNLLENKKDAVATVARIYGIGEDMIQGGAIFANKQNAIIQTYSDYKGLIYTWINQIESQVISFRNIENYEVTFSGVPQLENTPKINEIPLELLNTLNTNEKREAIGYEPLQSGIADTSLLSEKLGVGGTQSMLAIVLDPVLTNIQKAGALKVLFSLSDADIAKILPQPQPTKI